MSGKKSFTNAYRKLGKTGNVDSPSYFLTIPIEVVRAMQWQDGQALHVKKSRGKVVIETVDEPTSDSDLNHD